MSPPLFSIFSYLSFKNLFHHKILFLTLYLQVSHRTQAFQKTLREIWSSVTIFTYSEGPKTSGCWPEGSAMKLPAQGQDQQHSSRNCRRGGGLRVSESFSAQDQRCELGVGKAATVVLKSFRSHRRARCRPWPRRPKQRVWGAGWWEACSLITQRRKNAAWSGSNRLVCGACCVASV